MMEVKEKTIFASRIEHLRDPWHEQALARFWKETAPTANTVCDQITFAVLDAYFDGTAILTARGDELDLDRMEQTEEPFVRRVDGKLITLLPGLKLKRLDEAFGENTRRTMNRLFEKIQAPGRQAVQGRMLPLMFWLDVARKIRLSQLG